MKRVWAALVLSVVVGACGEEPSRSDDPTSGGSIAGSVRDASSDLPIPGATIAVSGTGRETSADGVGEYSLGGIPAGLQEAVASAFGYQSSATSVTIVEGSTSFVDFRLASEAPP